MDDTFDAVFGALADPTRRRILDELRKGPRTTGDLIACAPGLSRFAVMKHLKVLTGAGLVTVRPEGRKVWNYLNVIPLRRVYERWVSPFADLWATSLEGLKRTVEDDNRRSKS
ncbi:MAG: ArsR/SmtB family transcription factor [Phycisphaerales bacterium]